MTAHTLIPREVLQLQTDASDPHVSAWVAANAGSGKTHVLAQRVIRLLLNGCPPSRILCLTFTKAAAANMASRVFDTLAKWTALDDTALDHEIVTTDARRPDSLRRARARRLFAEALETPGGLKVLTIHAFCTRLLHQFPFEADVAARFTVLEERTEAELIDSLAPRKSCWRPRPRRTRRSGARSPSPSPPPPTRPSRMSCERRSESATR